MKFFSLFLVLGFLVTSLPAAAQPTTYQDGDLIFHESRTRQSRAIQEATNSRWSHVGILFFRQGHWYVAEAVQPVRFTMLTSFIARGKNQDYEIYRVPGLTESQQENIRTEVDKFMGQNYDPYFEWSDDSIYCSELVYKTFIEATGIEVGQVQKFGDLRLDGPYVKELIRRRIEDRGRTLDLKEPIVTPASQINDERLRLVEQSDSTPALRTQLQNCPHFFHRQGCWLKPAGWNFSLRLLAV